MIVEYFFNVRLILANFSLKNINSYTEAGT
jgi:hypothetical protein